MSALSLLPFAVSWLPFAKSLLSSAVSRLSSATSRLVSAASRKLFAKGSYLIYLLWFSIALERPHPQPLSLKKGEGCQRVKLVSEEIYFLLISIYFDFDLLKSSV